MGMYQLCRVLSMIPVDHEKLSVILAEVADFHQPKVQERGYFQLKPEWWTKFDPLFAQFYLNELEDAQECHQLLWNVLNYVKILVKNNQTSTAGEALGVTALQMMEIALQKAFLEQHGDHQEEDDEHGYDDAGPTEGSHVGSEAGGNFERISGKAPAVVTLTETTFGIQECAFCRRKCDSSDSPAGWIAFMQCYNMPRQVLKKERAQRVKILEEAESIAKGDDSKQLVTLIEPQIHDSGVCEGGSLDYYPTEHVACCGHQMHQACFESYVSNLGHQHHQGNCYEGDYIIDVVNHGEIWCPICRRLANVLLPVVEESCLQRILDGQAEGSADENLSRRRLWDPWKKIVKAIDGFASQTVRVREKFCVMPEAKDVPSCQLLWEVFAGNIVHFEVETREKINDSGSSSSAPIRLRDAWGGEAGHLTALRELGKLAMLSNTIQADIVSEKKKEQLKRLWHDLALLCRNEKKMDAPGSFDLNSAPVWQHLMEILEKLFPTDGSCSKREVDMKSGYEPQPSSGEYQPSTIPEIHKYEYMHPNFLEGPLLEVDPFAILTCLLLSVQLVPCEELDTKHYGSGLPLVTKLQLIESEARVGLQGENKQITVLGYLQQRFSTSELLNSPSWGIPSLPECSDFDCVRPDRSKQIFTVVHVIVNVTIHAWFTCSTIPLQSFKAVVSHTTAFSLPGLQSIELVVCAVVIGQDLLWSIPKMCKVCGNVPIDAAFCLICGDLLCFKSKCSGHAAEHGVCSTHAEQEYAGIGIFLLMRTTQVLLMRGNRVCTLPSIYLDQHGEEDYELRRNQKLYKSELRLNKVQSAVYLSLLLQVA
ncbi:unnamed protein product [Sphagnum jensenii]